MRPGGCGVTVTQFVNQGAGLYDIRIVPFVGNPACAWLSGEYVYAVQLEFTRTIDGDTVSPAGRDAGQAHDPVGRSRRGWPARVASASATS